MIALSAQVAAAEPPPAQLSAYARPGRRVALPDGQRINLRCAGSGSPTVVLEAGLGWGSLSWRKVQPALSRLTRTCAYDRAGLGFSDPARGAVGPQSAARDLKAALQAAGETDAPVLVGSSYGALVVRSFAAARPGAAAGVVLVDPVTPGQVARLAAIAPFIARDAMRGRKTERVCRDLMVRARLSRQEAVRRGCVSAPSTAFPADLRKRLWRERMSAAGAQAVYAETRGMDAFMARPDRRRPGRLGDLPLVVLTASRSMDEDEASPAVRRRLLVAWRALHAELAALSTRGAARLVEGSGHVIQSEAPDAVVDAVAQVVRTARADARFRRPAPPAGHPPR